MSDILIRIATIGVIPVIAIERLEHALPLADALLADYLKLKTVAAAGGTWIAKNEDMAANDWETITQRCWEACAVAAACRAS